MSAMDAMSYQWCLCILVIFAILKNKNVDYCCILVELAEGGAINLSRNIDLTQKEENKWVKIFKRLIKLKIKKKNVPSWKSYFLKDVGIEKALVSNKISSGEKTINTLLITCITIVELSHYI